MTIDMALILSFDKKKPKKDKYQHSLDHDKRGQFLRTNTSLEYVLT